MNILNNNNIMKYNDIILRYVKNLKFIEINILTKH